MLTNEEISTKFAPVQVFWRLGWSGDHIRDDMTIIKESVFNVDAWDLTTKCVAKYFSADVCHISLMLMLIF